jgi:hypothetical protein
VRAAGLVCHHGYSEKACDLNDISAKLTATNNEDTEH